jgi:hypothetical protein
MGTHLIMDFAGIPEDRIDLNSYEKISKLLEEGIALSNAQIIDH